MGLLGPIDAETRMRMVRALRGRTPGLVQTPLNLLPPPYWSAWELLCRRAEELGESSFITYYDDELDYRVTLSYADVAAQARRVAAFMRGELSLGPGDVIAVADLYNHPDAIAIYFAAWACGILVTPINMREDRRRHQQVLRHSQACAVFARDRQDPGATDNYLTRMTALAGDLGIPHIVQLGGEERRAAHWLDEWESDDIGDVGEFFPMDTPALLVYAAGTTGTPRGIVLTHSMLYDVRALAEQDGVGRDDILFSALPISHVYAIVSGVLGATYLGATLVLDRRFNPATLLERVEDEGVTVMSVVPAMLSAVLEHIRSEGISVRSDYPEARRSLRYLFCGGGPLYPSLAREAQRLLDVQVLHGWGMAELVCSGSHLPLDLTKSEYERLVLDAPHPSIGTPNESLRLGVLDPETGEPSQPGERGVLVAAGPGLMAGYYRNATLNERAFRHGVLETGDEGYYEVFKRDNGETMTVFFMTGHLRDVIERGGVEYSLAEIEGDLQKIPSVVRGLVVGYPHHALGEEVGAFVQLASGTDLDEAAVWRHFMTLGYPWDKTPKRVFFVDELPETPLGPAARESFLKHFEGMQDEIVRRPDYWGRR